MCKVYNQLGSLKTVKNCLLERGISDLQSTNELITFHKNYASIRQQAISGSKAKIQEEREKLTEEVKLLEDFIQTCREEYSSALTEELEKMKHQLASLPHTSGFFDKFHQYF